MSLIFINRAALYPFAVECIEGGSDATIKEMIREQLLFDADDNGEIVTYQEFKKIQRAIEVNDEIWVKGYVEYTYRDFISDLTKMIMKAVLNDFKYLLKVAKNKNKFGHLYLTDEEISTEPSNEYFSLGSGRLILQGFDWSYDENNEYDYSFNIYISL